ncbi:class I SAM-dependent methyltransferase [Paraburkholderia sp. HD33-4]|uniref:class I SAM-dependent methyltransferase n=1 Tax=Paraburkholderia sp. HD33-4 TaxID=2883242 RepID=UPI001F1A0A6B|nr:class I SAM-dependent methyltransferase [Paraburkholderia sp. HD33-4]
MSVLRDLYSASELPVFQNRMYATAEEARNCPLGDVRLVEDLSTGLVYNAAFRPELVVYDQHYQNEQAVSAQFRAHLEQVAAIVERRLGRHALIEVACGKGFFLEMLAQRGCEITGFDPAYEGSNPSIEKRYFAPGAGVTGRGLILRHVLEHVVDPLAFLAQLREANQGEGTIYIEVPCFEWICEQGAWFDVFYEHVNYFRPVDFLRMFDVVHESGHLFGGQYIYVVADLRSLRMPAYDENQRVRLPATFGARERHMHADANQAVIWGGASKGVIFALQRMRSGAPIHTVVDINPAKQGKYLPATGLRVESPDEVLPRLSGGTTIYVMNSNYLDEIRVQAGPTFQYIGIDHE